MKKLFQFIFIISVIGLFAHFSFSEGGTRIFGIYGIGQSPATFSQYGNAGTIDLNLVGSDASGVLIESDGSDVYLTGMAYVQTVGWAQFSDLGQGKVYLKQDPSHTDSTDPYYASGFAWTPNAGWIKLNPDIPGSWSGVEYRIVSQTFSGMAWSNTLGWVSFRLNSVLIPTGRIKIIGTAGERKNIFDIYGDIGFIYNANIAADAMNNVRKKVALALRNVPDTRINKSTIFPALGFNTFNSILAFTFSGDSSGSGVKLSQMSTSIDDTTRSIIMIGGDVYIDTDLPPSTKGPRAIIALKNEAGSGGNIYIAGNVKQIHASLITEGSIYSGYKDTNGAYLYNDTKEKIISILPRKQLYVKGSMISKNTIGGSANPDTVRCPMIEPDCTRDTALKYDMNYLRNYDGESQNEALPGYGTYSMIIEYDANILRNPPPGL